MSATPKDKVYIYPKTSCPCASCKNSYTEPNTGIKSSRAIRGCEESPYFDCYDRVEISKGCFPTHTEPGVMTAINPRSYTDKVAGVYNKVACPTICSENKGGEALGAPWIGNDPRLYSSTRSDYLLLDIPPITGKVKLKDIYDKKYDNYEIGFKNYDDIVDGQIVYYTDTSTNDAMFSPVFSEKSNVSTVLYRDPMGSMQPEYNREAILNTKNPATSSNYPYPYTLSALQDSQSFREDLMALQMRVPNRSKWTARWANANA